MQTKWPVLSYEKGKDTYETLHMWTQIVGKIKLETLPWVNHSWHITLHITPLGLTTQMIPYQNQNFQIDFDFIGHRLKINTSQGEYRQFDLHNISVADFYKKLFELLKELDIKVKINPNPCEVEHPIPLNEDTVHATYNEEQVKAFHQALLQIQNVFFQFRSGFKGKSSAVHFFWGSFDLALSFFSGRKAPKHPGGIPGMPNWVAEEAYCREVSSCGFWPGSEALPEAAFYCYHYPAPDGYGKAQPKPEKAYFHETLGEFILPYSVVQQAKNSAKVLREFLDSTYCMGADLANWDREILEKKNSGKMKTSRLEAFSDGVLAIIITIMVLELEIPKSANFEDLKPLLPVFLSYVLSFIYVGIYWNNHHHLFQAVEKVNGKVLWANLFLLFSLSLIPFSTAWLGENHVATAPVVLYGIFLLLAAIAFYLLAHFLVGLHGKDSTIGRAIGKDWKTKISLILYGTAILFGFFYPWVSIGLYIAVAIIWFIPDTRIEKNIEQ